MRTPCSEKLDAKTKFCLGAHVTAVVCFHLSTSGTPDTAVRGYNDNTELRRVLCRVEQVVYHRLIPEDAFKPYDPTRSGSVTEPVFRRGLSDAFRMPFNDDQLETLSQRYRNGGNKVRIGADGAGV